MPALSLDGAVAAAGDGQACGGSRGMPSNRRCQQQVPSPASGSGPSAMQQHLGAVEDCRFGQLRRKAPLTKRRTCFDSAEFFMAKEAGLAPLPLYQPRTEPTCMLRKPSQPSRLSIGAD